MMKALIETNPYLKDRKTHLKLVKRSAITSSGVEGVEIPEHFEHIEIPQRKKKLDAKLPK